MNRSLLALTLAASLVAPFAATAGPFAEFENKMRDVYGDYRVALFQSNKGDVQATYIALLDLANGWNNLRADWQGSPPPQYQDDPNFAATLTKVMEHIDKAAGQLGKLPEAHITLEAVRDEIGDLHLRNGLFRFSDRMNAYHAQMEHVLETDYAAMGDKALGMLREEAAVLTYLAQDIVAHPAPEASNPAYAGLVAGLGASVKALTDATRAGDLEAALEAVGKLKMPYAQLFAKFG